ncbi:MAG: hypothetical protein ACJAV4_000180 [Pontimonas sp.]|jgi:hypothetical protein
MRKTFCGLAIPVIAGIFSLSGCAPSAVVTPVDSSSERAPNVSPLPDVGGARDCDVPTERGISSAIGTQIDALRAGDFSTAYAVASPEFQNRFNQSAFEAVIREGYSFLLETSSYTLSECVHIPSASQAQTRVTLRTTNGEVWTLRYRVEGADQTWRIEGAELSESVSSST